MICLTTSGLVVVVKQPIAAKLAGSKRKALGLRALQLQRGVYMTEMMTEKMTRDYAFYKAKLAALQATEDELNDELGLGCVDLAWQKTVEREQARNMPTFSEMQRALKHRLALRDYSQAIGVSAV